MTNEFKIFKENEKLDESFTVIVEKMNAICKQYQLNYYEMFELIECYKVELLKQLDKEEKKDG